MQFADILSIKLPLSPYAHKRTPISCHSVSRYRYDPKSERFTESPSRWPYRKLDDFPQFYYKEAHPCFVPDRTRNPGKYYKNPMHIRASIRNKFSKNVQHLLNRSQENATIETKLLVE